MKATDHLLNDHKLIRKVLENFSPENPRYPQLLKTLSRSVIGHAWFEDEIFLPAFKRYDLLHKLFSDEITQEHRDMDQVLKQLNRYGLDQKKETEFLCTQLRAILENHLKKEEDGLFPLAERLLDTEGLNQLGEQMEQRKTEIRPLVKDYY